MSCFSFHPSKDLAQGGDQTVDVFLGVDLGDAVHGALAQSGEVPGQVLAAEDALAQQSLVDLRRGLTRLGEVHHELLEEGGLEADGEVVQLGDLLGGVLG